MSCRVSYGTSRDQRSSSGKTGTQDSCSAASEDQRCRKRARKKTKKTCQESWKFLNVGITIMLLLVSEHVFFSHLVRKLSFDHHLFLVNIRFHFFFNQTQQRKGKLSQCQSFFNHKETNTNNSQLSERGLNGVSYHHWSYVACS